ncbi:hypothetical protein [Mycobacterium sp. C31M]
MTSLTALPEFASLLFQSSFSVCSNCTIARYSVIMTVYLGGYRAVAAAWR